MSKIINKQTLKTKKNRKNKKLRTKKLNKNKIGGALGSNGRPLVKQPKITETNYQLLNSARVNAKVEKSFYTKAITDFSGQDNFFTDMFQLKSQDKFIIPKTQKEYYRDSSEIYVNSFKYDKTTVVPRTLSTIPDIQISNTRAADEKINAKSRGKSGKRLHPSSAKNITHESGIENLTASRLLLLLSDNFFIYNDNNEIIGMRQYIDREHLVISEKYIQQGTDIIIVDYENYDIGLRNVSRSFKINNNSINIFDICKIMKNVLFIFVKPVSTNKDIINFVEFNDVIPNVIIINVYAKKNPIKMFADNGSSMPPYTSNMIDDYVILYLYEYLTKKGFGLSILSRDRYNIYKQHKTLYYFKPTINSKTISVSPGFYNINAREINNFINNILKNQRYFNNFITNKNNLPVNTPSIPDLKEKLVIDKPYNNYYYLLIIFYVIQNL